MLSWSLRAQFLAERSPRSNSLRVDEMPFPKKKSKYRSVNTLVQLKKMCVIRRNEGRGQRKITRSKGLFTGQITDQSSLSLRPWKLVLSTQPIAKLQWRRERGWWPRCRLRSATKERSESPSIQRLVRDAENAGYDCQYIAVAYK